jgi:hypothetical protein
MTTSGITQRRMDLLSTLSPASSASLGSLENDRGDITAGKDPLIAAAGEYLVTGELLRRGGLPASLVGAPQISMWSQLKKTAQFASA